MRNLPGLFFVVFVVSFADGAVAAEPEFVNPLIKKFGAVAVQPDVAEPPRKGARIVFDITSESKPGEVLKGLESVARYLNLNAQAGNSASDVRLALVVHGGATKAALNDSGYATTTGAASNPNLALVRDLKKHGVEVFVCGQSLARNKYSLADVAPEFKVAASAMTVNVNKQQDGYAYVSLH
ncbi:MAG: DsrE family protein [Planctomycetales bacterium]|nr:DsrE family protein [Planctomycetales bacterium]MBN8625429.1 DsrE family protein [Planctomycetota bacterium]